MEYWLAHRTGKVVEQIFVEDGQTPRWSTDSSGASKVKVDRHGDLQAEVFDRTTLTWSPSVANAARLLRQERNRLLLECDNPPLFERPEAQQPVWRAYRQALRDLPSATTDPLNPIWPTPPQ